MLDDMFMPNGLCFSPDYRKLYVVDTGITHHPDASRNIRVYDVVDGTSVKNGREFVSLPLKTETGALTDIGDTEGNLWAGAAWGGRGFDGVHIFAPDGDRIGQILLPEGCANLCFGGAKRNRLFMMASQWQHSVLSHCSSICKRRQANTPL